VTRTTPTPEHAEGMLAGILAQREREGLTGPHPYDHLDLSDPVDRRIVGAVYAEMARAALRGL
jgi:hypothetical protein